MFDPYHEWLGIPATDRRPSLYRLLGISELETNPDVIANAAERCHGFLRSFQSGPRGPIAVSLIEDVSLANRILLDPEAKARYDAALCLIHRGHLPIPPMHALVAAQPAKVIQEHLPEPPPPPLQAEEEIVSVLTPIVRLSRRWRRGGERGLSPLAHIAIIIGGGVIGLGLGAAILSAFFNVDAMERFGLKKTQAQPVETQKTRPPQQAKGKFAAPKPIPVATSPAKPAAAKTMPTKAPPKKIPATPAKTPATQSSDPDLSNIDLSNDTLEQIVKKLNEQAKAMKSIAPQPKSP